LRRGFDAVRRFIRVAGACAVERHFAAHLSQNAHRIDIGLDAADGFIDQQANRVQARHTGGR
jgi:hypothetical protein